MSDIINSGVLSSTLRVSVPLLFAALGCLLCERAGITNLSMEGSMLTGAFGSIVMLIWFNGNPWFGMVGGIIGGLFLSSVFGLAVVKFKSNHIITSIACNMLGAGITAFLMRSIFDSMGTLRPTENHKLGTITIPILNKIPLIGPAISNQNILVYVSILLVFLILFILKRTEFGLNINSVGQSEEAVKTAGIKPNLIRWQVVLISGALSGLAGSFVSSYIVSEFTENMINGRGFTAYTSVVFGNASPIGTWLATLLFAFADAIGIQIELLGTFIPPAAIKMLPYILAIIVLVINSASKKYKGISRKKEDRKLNKKAIKKVEMVS